MDVGRSECVLCVFFFFKQKTAYEMCGRDWSSDVCSSDLFYLLEVLEAFTANAVYRLSGNDKDAIICLDAQLDRKSVV